MTPLPTASPDADAIRRFVSVVFAGLPGIVCCRVLAEKGGPDARPRTRYFPNDPDLAASLLREAEAAGRAGSACFVVPATVARAGRAKAQDIAATSVLLVDLDADDVTAKRNHLACHLGPPTLEVASGGVTESGQRKLHLYWRLTNPASESDLAHVAALRGMIARKVGGDPAFARLPQPIRVAGSVHRKHGRSAPVEIVAERPAEYALAEIAAAAWGMPELTSEDSQMPTEGQVRAGGVDGVTRYDAMSRFIGGKLRERRLGRISRDAAWTAVAAYNERMLVPPWEEGRLRREFEALERVDLAASDGAGDGAGACPSEDELARRLATCHGARLKHSAATGGWLRWTGTLWAPETKKAVVELARICCRDAAHASPQHRTRLLSQRTIRAVADLASADPAMSAEAMAWDADLMRLNTPAGIVDLVTGEIRRSDPTAAMTRITAAAPAGPCPTWLRFLRTFTDGDAELAAYLARLAGYCLTGSTKEQAFFFLLGGGSNGKSVFLGALSEMLGSYATAAPLDTFMASRSDRHPTDMAGLRGARLVGVTEVEPGRSWAESRIKTLTGGDPVQARVMHRDFFQFVPCCKLVVAGNHRPRLSSCGEAMRRRLHLIPCRATISAEARDRDLPEKLRAELGGILSWALAGCAEWQRVGLAPPRAVSEAAARYFEDEDRIGQWIAECCVTGPNCAAATQTLFDSWTAWASQAGVETGYSRAFCEALRERGFDQVRNSRYRGWSGLRLSGSARPSAVEEVA